MRPEQRAREFVEAGFRGLGVPSLEPYIEIIAELIEGAVNDEREACALIADSYRCGVCGMDGKAAAEIRHRLLSAGKSQ